MNSNEFVSWLKGFVEGCGTELSETQVNNLKERLENVYEVNCPPNTQPTLPYSPPWTIGDQTGDPYKVWFSTSTGVAPFSTDLND